MKHTKIRILSHKKLVQQAVRPFPEKTAVISIRNPGDEKTVFKYQPERILYLEFDDITESELREVFEAEFGNYKNIWRKVNTDAKENAKWLFL